VFRKIFQTFYNKISTNHSPPLNKDGTLAYAWSVVAL